MQSYILDDYLIAREKTKKAEVLTDIQSEMDDMKTKKTRKRR